MSNISVMLNGMYPRSDTLAAITRDHDRHRVNDGMLAEQYASDRHNLYLLQEDFTYVTDGQLNWQDIFRPIVMACKGMTTAGLVRYFNTNTFYRQPLLESDNPTINVDALIPYFNFYQGTQQQKATLPSPVTFYQMTHQTKYSYDGILNIMLQVCKWLTQQGIRVIEFQEPWLTYNSANIAADHYQYYHKSYQKLIKTVKSYGSDVKVGVQLTFGNAAPILPIFEGVELNYIGIDFYATELNAIKSFKWNDKGISAGCINGRNSLLEKPAMLQQFIDEIAEVLNPRKIYLTNNVEMSFLPQQVANKKLAIMAEVQQA